MPNSNAFWYAVQTKPRQEMLASQILQRLNIETFYPRITPTRPLFASYIFARFDVQTHIRRVKFAQGVRNIVSFGTEFVPVDDYFLDAIRLRMKENYVVLDGPSFEKGERVRIMKGPLTDIEGVFDSRLKDSYRVVIFLNALTGQHRVILPVYLIKKAS